jgi:hypothetical protein
VVPVEALIERTFPRIVCTVKMAVRTWAGSDRWYISGRLRRCNWRIEGERLSNRRC